MRFSESGPAAFARALQARLERVRARELDLARETERLVEEVMEIVGRTHPAIRREVFYVIQEHEHRMRELLRGNRGEG